MKCYKSGEKWIVGLEGRGMGEERFVGEAIILNQPPVPLRNWVTPSEIIDSPFDEERWVYEYEFYEYQGDHEHFYFVKMDSVLPGEIRSESEFFVTREALEKKLEDLRNRNCLIAYEWRPNKRIWEETERHIVEEDSDKIYTQ
jgi:hypothetical protein